jgi:hypothetical protein
MDVILKIRDALWGRERFDPSKRRGAQHTDPVKRELTSEESAALLTLLRTRFECHANRHPGLKWDNVEKELRRRPGALWSLHRMEATGGEPDVVVLDSKAGALVFMDCSAESPKERHSLCYDDEALAARKEHKPRGSAVGMATEMGVELLTEDEYHLLQSVGEFDRKTSSWLKTPEPVRKLGGAIFGDRRFGRVFIYHNGVQSYYTGRGFRAVLRLE